MSVQALFEHMYEEQVITQEELDKVKAILNEGERGNADCPTDQPQYRPFFGSTTAFLLDEEQRMLKWLV